MRSAHIEQQHQAKRSTHLRTTTIGDSVFVINPRPLYIIRPDERTEAKLRICSRTCVDKLEHRIRPDEEDVTHMTKAKLSKGFELIGEHLPLPKCERSPGAGGEVQEVRQASCGRRLKLRSDVSGLSDKIPCHFFVRINSLLMKKMTSYPHTHLFHGENITVVISGHHIQLLHSKYAMTTPFAGLSLN
jgi:hypothetical protein